MRQKENRFVWSNPPYCCHFLCCWSAAILYAVFYRHCDCSIVLVNGNRIYRSSTAWYHLLDILLFWQRVIILPLSPFMHYTHTNVLSHPLVTASTRVTWTRGTCSKALTIPVVHFILFEKCNRSVKMASSMQNGEFCWVGLPDNRSKT